MIDFYALVGADLLEGARKSLRVWFRAIFEIAARRNGILAKELQRIMGFGSYRTAWTWLHKLRAALASEGREPLGPFVEIDEALVDGKGSPHKELVLVAAEAAGRVRLARADNNDAATLKCLCDAHVAKDAKVVSDGRHADYSAASLGERAHEAKVQTKAKLRMADAVQACHWTVLLLKHEFLGTHGGVLLPAYLQAYLDEYAFRHNRRPHQRRDAHRSPRYRGRRGSCLCNLDGLMARARRSPRYNPLPAVTSPERTA